MSVTNFNSKSNQSLVWAYNNGYKFIDGKIFGPKGCDLKFNINSAGYFYFGVKPPFLKRVISIKVHRFIGYAKFGDSIFSKGMVVRHLDNTKTNNNWDNIGIGSQQQNVLDIPKKTRLRTSLNAAKNKRKFSDKDIDLIRVDRQNGFTYKELMYKWKISSKGTIAYIINHCYQTKV
jgi:hypothetical protein